MYGLLLQLWIGETASSDATVSSAEPLAAPVAPFLNLRQTVLEYRGPEDAIPASGEIRIGWFGPTDGINPVAADAWWAARLAIEEGNAAPGVPVPLFFRLVPCWANDPWGAGVSRLARMIYEEQPLALIGSFDSASTHLAEQIVAKANLPLISPIATDKSITLAGVSWMFACAPSDAAIAPVLVEGMISALPERSGRLALLATTDHESRMTTREVLRELVRRQHPPDFRFDVTPGAHEISRQLSALVDADPAAVLIIAGVEDSAKLVQAVRRLSGSSARPAPSRFSPLLFGGQSMARTSFREMAGLAGEEIYFPLLGAANPTNSNAAAFTERFTAERHHPPDYNALLTYDATRLLLEAIRQAGPHRGRVRSALVRLSPWQGIAGAIAFDGTGQNTRTNVSLATWRGGRIDSFTGPARAQTTHISLHE